MATPNNNPARASPGGQPQVNAGQGQKRRDLFWTIIVIVLTISTLALVIKAKYFSGSSQSGATSSGQTTSSGQLASSPSSYRKITTRVLDVGTHIFHLKAGVKSETFTFAGGVKGSSTYFASNGCRMGYANGHPPVRACGSARGPLAPPGESLVSFAYKTEEDTQVVVVVR